MENSVADSKKEPLSLLEIIVIASFISLIFSPVGVFLMWWKTKWTKKLKIIVSAVFGVVVAALIALLVFLNLNPNGGGGNGGLPFEVNTEQNFSGGGGSGKKSNTYNPKPVKSNSKNASSGGNSSKEPVSSLSEVLKKSRLPYILFFVAVIVILIVLRNLKSDAKSDSDNPYVNTGLYKLPLSDDFVFPAVHFNKPQFTLQQNEKIIYATPAEQKNSPGDLVVTDKRMVFVGRDKKIDLPLSSLSAISSLSNTALLVTERCSDSSEKQHYFFVRDTQMRFVLAIVRWAYAHPSDSGDN